MLRGRQGGGKMVYGNDSDEKGSYRLSTFHRPGSNADLSVWVSNDGSKSVKLRWTVWLNPDLLNRLSNSSTSIVSSKLIVL